MIFAHSPVAMIETGPWSTGGSAQFVKVVSVETLTVGRQKKKKKDTEMLEEIQKIK